MFRRIREAQKTQLPQMLDAADLKADIYYLAATRRHPLTKTIPARSSVQAGSTKLAARTKSALPMG